MPAAANDARHFLGQFIPLHYHHNMLLDECRMIAFKQAIERVVRPGARVVDLGGGTGVLSWFAAVTAARVWCVEINPELVAEARRFLSLNERGHLVEVIEADAMDFLPPEPVDVVICEMTHAAMLREKQVIVLESFRRRYRERFAGPLPAFLPEAAILGVQPVEQNFSFHGFRAPIVQFQVAGSRPAGTLELAAPQVFRSFDFSLPNAPETSWTGSFHIEQDGTVNALRLMTRNVLALASGPDGSIDWHNHDLVLPIDASLATCAGDDLEVGLQYTAGASIAALQDSISIQIRRR